MSTEPEESRTASDSFSDFEDLETFLFERVGPHFRKTGQLRSMDFIAILVWKANRAKTRHIRRLVSKGFTLSQVVQAIADQLTSAPDQKSCLSMLMK